MHPSTAADLLRALQPEPGRPRLTWYGPDGERVELSGAVLENWVAKTANLLVEELDAGPGTRVVLDLPPHWRAVPWALAVWRVGAVAVLPGSRPTEPDVVVTDRPAPPSGHEAVVGVALGALARRFDGELPSGAIDAAAAVMTYADVLGWAPDVDPGAAALVLGDGRTVTHRDLGTWAAGATASAPGARVLVPAEVGRSRPDAVAHLLRVTWDALAAAGSVVLLDPTTSDEMSRDEARLARLVAGERVTARIG
jgi:uncharacterized protein (TIGR03089 family)